MKRFVTVLILFVAVLVMAQENQLPAPPNGVRVRDNLYIDRMEITNLNWLEYLHYLYKDSSAQHYTSALPDTTVWLTVGDSVKWKHYLRYPGYRHHPAVGITQQQAQAYCRWRTDAVNQRLQDERFSARLHVPAGYRFYFRLPTEAEWEEAASGGLPAREFPYGYRNFWQKPTLNKSWKFYYQTVKTRSLISEKAFRQQFHNYRKNGREAFFNCLKPFDDLLFYGALTPLTTQTTKEDRKNGNANTRPNALGIYEMIGNVAEIVAEPGVAKGGSWAHHMEESTIPARASYNQQEAWLGFRCICEVKKID
jgi:formylglycine-generating enzyme required for sulfatase activity